MKLYEMMDRTPLPGNEVGAADNKTYHAYMQKHRPNHFADIAKMLNHRFGGDMKLVQNYLNAINLGADMALLQVLSHGMPDDLGEVYGKAKLWTPGGRG